HHCSPVQYLLQLGVLEHAAGWLCIHCVQVDERDIDILRRAEVGLASCPRSNRAHAHGTAPLAALRAAGIPVGLGTDSVVSAGDVNLWAEAPDGGSHYAPPPETGAAIRPQLQQLLPTTLMSLDGVGPLLVLKTPAGSAQALGLALDAAGWTEIIGTVAGDDVVLVITRSERA